MKKTKFMTAYVDGSTMHDAFSYIKKIMEEKFGSHVELKFEQAGRFSGYIILNTVKDDELESEIALDFKGFASHAIIHRSIKKD